MPTHTFSVSGMTCEHCVLSVTEEVSELPGVTDVAVALERGEVTISSDRELSDESVTRAVEEAGYTVTGKPTNA